MEFLGIPGAADPLRYATPIRDPLEYGACRKSYLCFIENGTYSGSIRMLLPFYIREMCITEAQDTHKLSRHGGWWYDEIKCYSPEHGIHPFPGTNSLLARDLRSPMEIVLRFQFAHWSTDGRLSRIQRE